MKGFVAFGLLCIISGMDEGAGESGSFEGFRFRARLSSPSKRSESGKLMKGSAVKAVHPLYRGSTYQNVILCKDLALEFDAQGLSQEVEVIGFCAGPGQTVPVKEVEWWIPGYFYPLIRKHGCTSKTIAIVRGEQEMPGPAMTESAPVLPPCAGDESSCIEKFSAWLQLNYNITFSEARDKGICDRVSAPDSKEVRYELFCNETALSSLKEKLK